MLLKRFLTGVILAPLVVLFVLKGPAVGVAVLLGAAGLLALHELLRMWMPGRTLEHVGTLMLTGAALCVVHTWPEFGAWVAVGLLVGPGAIILLRPEPMEGAAGRLGALWGSIAYVGTTTSFLMLLGREPAHLLMAMAVVWFGDTGAYFGGKALGRHKLYPLISPNKTWEGAVAGLGASVLGAYVVHLLLLPELEMQSLVFVALLGGAVAQTGDLVESLFKRSCGVKDSGTLLPGHGGMLDRLDGLLFSAPIFAILL